MRHILMGLSALILTACGAEPGRQAPTLTFPLAVPASASPITADSIAVCSAAMESQAKGAGVLGQRAGWTFDATALTMGTPDTIMAVNEDAGVHRMIASAKYPHVDTVTCQLTGVQARFQGEPRAFSVDALEDLDGFRGAIVTMQTPPDEDLTFARYSAMAPNDDIMLIRADLSRRFDMMSMSRMTERRPQPGN